MVNQGKDISFERESEICVCRVQCSETALQTLYDYVRSLIDNRCVVGERPELERRFYINKGISYSVKAVYKMNISSEYCFEKNSQYFRPSSRENYVKSMNRITVLELVYDSDSGRVDTVDLQYLLLTMRYLDHVKEKYCVLFYRSSSLVGKRYLPLREDDYWRMRAYLCIEIASFDINRIMCLRNKDSIEENGYDWMRVFSENSLENPESLSSEKFFGKVLPLISINEDNYRFLLSRKHLGSSELSDIEKRWTQILNQYEKKACDKVSKSERYSEKDVEMFRHYFESDNFLEALMYYSTVLYFAILKEEPVLELPVIHEYCMDFAQGIIQLIENVLVHVIGRRNDGCGNFSIRIREKERVKHLLRMENAEKSKRIESTKFFLEVFVSDAYYDVQNFRGMVSRFLKNAQDEKRASSEVLLENENEIELKDLFEETKLMKQYLSDYENVAYHYGLQILQNVIISNDGCFSVRSGVGKKDFYFNNPQMYVEQDIKWHAGTSYRILLPIVLTSTVPIYPSTLAIKDFMHSSSSIESKEIKIDFNGNVSPFKKKENVEFIKNSILNNEALRLGDSGSENTVYYLNCINVRSMADYELLAKAVFSCLASESGSKLNHIALINVNNEYEVIKLFRQFALFYNRNGENPVLDRRSVFIVDKEAKLDFLLNGNLANIITYMEKEQIYGGIEETEMRIVHHLGGYRDAH